MRAADIVAHLQRRLPLLTTLFTDSIAVSSIVHAGTTATITTGAAHGLVAGQAIHVMGAVTPIAVASIAHTPGSGVATVTTSADHDLTLYSKWTPGNVATISGAVEGAFNGTKPLLAVHNRRSFDIAVSPAAPASATGTILLLNGSNVYRTVRGLYEVKTVPDSTHLTISHTGASDLGTLAGTITLRTTPRITGAVNAAAAGASYSMEYPGGLATAKAWAYVILRDVSVVADRRAAPQVIAQNTLASDWEQRIVQPFTVLVAFPSASDQRGRIARDSAEDLLQPMLQSLLGKSFPTGLARSKAASPVQFQGHSGQDTEPRPYYLHGYDFEQTALVGIDDTVNVDDNVAFRDIRLDLGTQIGTGQMATDIDLDDVPL